MRPIDFERLVTEHVADAEADMLKAQECAGATLYYVLVQPKRRWHSYVSKRQPGEHRGRQRRATWEQPNA